MESTPDGERPPGPGDPAAPAPPPGIPHHPHPPHFPAPGPAWPPQAAYGPPPPPRRDRSPVVWVGVGAAALTSLAAFAACLLVVALAPPPEQSETVSAAADPADHTSSQFEARPAPVEIEATDHPAYALPMPDPVACSLPDVDAGSTDSWVGYNDALSDCLSRLWRPRLEELGLRSVEPEFRVSDSKPETEGSVDADSTPAYYNGREMTITLVLPNVVTLARRLLPDVQQDLWALLLAHEYGHHVQELTGILRVGSALEREAPAGDERMRMTRRIELQAECLAGVGLQGLEGVGDADIDRFDRLTANSLATDTHGTGPNRSFWFSHGAGGDTLGACDTFSASATEVA